MQRQANGTKPGRLLVSACKDIKLFEISRALQAAKLCDILRVFVLRLDLFIKPSVDRKLSSEGYSFDTAYSRHW